MTLYRLLQKQQWYRNLNRKKVVKRTILPTTEQWMNYSEEENINGEGCGFEMIWSDLRQVIGILWISIIALRVEFTLKWRHGKPTWINQGTRPEKFEHGRCNSTDSTLISIRVGFWPKGWTSPLRSTCLLWSLGAKSKWSVCIRQVSCRKFLIFRILDSCALS